MSRESRKLLDPEVSVTNDDFAQGEAGTFPMAGPMQGWPMVRSPE